jgi:excisionase family DNA binding protein
MTHPRRRRLHVTPSMVARWLDIHEETVIRAIRARALPALRTGSGNGTRYRIFRKDLAVFLLRHGLTEERVTELLAPVGTHFSGAKSRRVPESPAV